MSPKDGQLSLEVDVEKAWYGVGAPVLESIQFEITRDSVLAIIGANGAGKTTLFRSIVGKVPYAGAVVLEGRSIDHLSTGARIRAGIALVPEEKALFPTLSVEKHLKLSEARAGDGIWTRSRVLDLFPNLSERLHLRAGLLSGGEQQMLAISRALLLNPRVLLLDEPSLGLAPALAQDLFRDLAEIAGTGTPIVINEQNITLVQGLATRLIVLRHGRVTYESDALERLSESELMKQYF